MENLKSLRIFADSTQVELAQQTGLSRMRISLAECNQLQLRPEEAKLVRSVLRTKIAHRITQLEDALADLK